MMKNVLLIVGVVSLLSGCVYVENRGCVGNLWHVQCIRDRSDFDAYMKADQNKAQKTQDITDCGGTISRYDNIFNGIVERSNEKTKTETPYKQRKAKRMAVEHFDACMVSKGYQFVPQ